MASANNTSIGAILPQNSPYADGGKPLGSAESAAEGRGKKSEVAIVTRGRPTPIGNAHHQLIARGCLFTNVSLPPSAVI
jgi:hypothetical protein